MIKQYKKLISLLPEKERRRFWKVFAATVLMGLIQVAGVGSIIPFVSLLVNRNLIDENFYLAWVYNTIEFSTTNDFLIFIGIAVLVVLILGNAFTAYTHWLIARFAHGCQVYLSTTLLKRYLARPYSFFINRNSTEIGKNILFESIQLTQGVLMPSLRILAYGMTAVFLVGFLLWLNPTVTLIAAMVFAISYAVIYLSIRRPLDRLGKKRLEVNSERFKSVNEAFGSVKEVKVLHREPEFVARYVSAATTFAKTLVAQQVYGLLPRYIVETVLFSLVMAMFLYLLYVDAQMQSVIPLASAFAFAAYRLMPTMQQIFGGVNALRFNSSVLDALYKDITDDYVMPVEKLNRSASKRLEFNDKIRMEYISYTYPMAERKAIEKLTITIPRQSFVAFVGETGSGKSTLAGIILGLLVPQDGRVTVDDVEINQENVRLWQENLGYVPQEIYLSDCTIAENIAFGMPKDQIDQVSIEKAAKIANIHHFISKELAKGYDTVVGERGVRLSGGQRQRIGIARALYHDPDVMVLDEATSALDGATEKAVHKAILQAAAVKTVILIAHRLDTVKDCDRIYLLDCGKVQASGTFRELLEVSDDFRRIASR